MSFLKKVFGEKPKKAAAPSLSEAIIRLKTTEDGLLRQQNSLEEKIQKEVATAKRNASANKKVALQALQRKKRFERRLQQVDGALTTLEAQRDVLENANTNSLAVASMEKASKALKATHKDLDVDKVERILDDLADQRELTDEIADAISHPSKFEEEFDEEELERELEELEEDLGDLAISDKLPSVPQTDVDKKEKKREKQTIAAS